MSINGYTADHGQPDDNYEAYCQQQQELVASLDGIIVSQLTVEDLVIDGQTVNGVPFDEYFGKD